MGDKPKVTKTMRLKAQFTYHELDCCKECAWASRDGWCKVMGTDVVEMRYCDCFMFYW